MTHDEFPPLTRNAEAVLNAAQSTSHLFALSGPDIDLGERRFAAAVIRAAIALLGTWKFGDNFPRVVDANELEAIADNLHSLPPPPPTREEMESALRGMENEFVTNLDFSRYAQVLQRGIAHYCKQQP